MSTINFVHLDKKIYDTKELHPQPMRKFAPEWYKNIPNNVRLTGFDKSFHKHFDSLNHISTIKTCPSFVDVFQEGYVLLAPQDYLFKYEPDTDTHHHYTSSSFNNGTESQVNTHSNTQMVDYLPQASNILFVFKIILPINIITNKGYSTRMMPMPYDFNEDWHCNYGVFKTDLIHQLNIQINITSGDKEILIKQGEPLCVLIPYKRETYNSNNILLEDNKKIQKIFNRFNALFEGKLNKKYYRNKWHKK